MVVIWAPVFQQFLPLYFWAGAVTERMPQLHRSVHFLAKIGKILPTAWTLLKKQSCRNRGAWLSFFSFIFLSLFLPSFPSNYFFPFLLPYKPYSIHTKYIWDILGYFSGDFIFRTIHAKCNCVNLRIERKFISWTMGSVSHRVEL